MHSTLLSAEVVELLGVDHPGTSGVTTGRSDHPGVLLSGGGSRPADWDRYRGTDLAEACGRGARLLDHRHSPTPSLGIGARRRVREAVADLEHPGQEAESNHPKHERRNLTSFLL